VRVKTVFPKALVQLRIVPMVYLSLLTRTRVSRGLCLHCAGSTLQELHRRKMFRVLAFRRFAVDLSGIPLLRFTRSITMNELRALDPWALDPFDDAFRSLMRPWRFDMPENAPGIKIDLTEQNGSYAVKAEIPGVKKDDIDVRVDGNTVTISAEVKAEKEEKGNGGRVLRRERQEGYASRSFILACPVDEGKVEASYKDGILALTLPKMAGTASKRIAIQ
jgi:HSP20 family protein